MSTLKLIMEKGPRNGETLEFNMRSTIRLGRVVRGNNVYIKDPGISTKHLEIHFHSGSGKWILTDLDSSNGTILNSTQIEALNPVVINDNDFIKVGELTAIGVSIVGTGNRLKRAEIGGNLRVEDEVRVRVRVSDENKSDGVINDSEDVRVSLEENDGGKGAEVGKEKQKRRGRPKKVNVVEEGDDEYKGNEGNTRRTRSSRKEVDELVSLDVEPVSRARKAKKVDNVTLLKVEEERNLDEGGGGDGEAGNVGVAESKRARGGRGRARKKDVKELEEGIMVNEQSCTRLLKVEVSEEGNVKGGVETRTTRSSRRDLKKFVSLDVGKPARRTRSSKNVKNVACDRELESLGEVESKKMVEVKEESDVVEESPIEEMRNDLVKAAVSEMVDATENNVVEAKESSDKKRCSSESMNVITEQNELEDKMNQCLLDVNVTEHVEGDISEKHPYAEPMCDFVQVDTQEDSINENVLVMEDEREEQRPLSLNQQPCSESVNEIVQQIELNDEANIDASIMEKEISDKLESNSGMEDEIMEESEIPEETSPGYDGEEAESESLKPPNLEKMTLGEWFDYLEVYLPKQIHAQTGAIVEDMRKRARQFDEFMLQHLKEKGKLPTSK